MPVLTAGEVLAFHAALVLRSRPGRRGAAGAAGGAAAAAGGGGGASGAARPQSLGQLRRQRCKEVLAAMGLAGQANTLVGEGGMRFVEGREGAVGQGVGIGTVPQPARLQVTCTEDVARVRPAACGFCSSKQAAHSCYGIRYDHWSDEPDWCLRGILIGERRTT